MKAKSDPCYPFCEDKNDTDHWDSGGCGTDYCGSWHETRCRLCGWYTTSCRCMSCSGQSKITEKQQRAIEKRKKK